ncbi:Protein SDS23 [Porphyridium purpureum]|uniref:Protein SDS23 n=1 Tax=Porphyridium purpureum TaxID=35688 RepID=A0A5J4Z6I3_PORPP|nr:Protein SDS23 [Porphyridium purpureum]|eukprot:POR8349..scf295_1
MMMATALMELTVGQVAKALPEHPKLHAVSIEATVDSAFEYMDHEGITVAPVLDNGTYPYLLSVVDLVDYVMLRNLDATKTGTASLTAAELQPENVPGLKDTLEKVIEGRDASYFELPSVEEAAPFWKLLCILAEGRHKVLVKGDPQGKYAGRPYLFSQHDAISYLNENPALLPEALRASTAEAMGYSPRPIYKAKKDMRVVELIRELVRMDITAVPLVDDTDRVIGNFSTSDLKGMDDVMLQDLVLPVVTFLKEENARGAGHPIVVHEDADLGEIIVLLAYSGAHRVWIVDKDNKAVGVCAMTDIISSIITTA